MARLLLGEVRDVLPTLPDRSVRCCVTSPPYWGLRDYGTAQWEGGDRDCDHRELRGGVGIASAKQVTSAGASTTYQYRECCGKCGARRIDRQLGLEPTPEEYVANLVAVFRQVRRVLTEDGTLWLNLGDSYANDAKWGGSSGGKHVEALHGKTGIGRQKVTTGLKPKDLVGIPWRVAFALQADGWYLRSDIIWAKPNPMPESVTDRPTKAHEYLFLLAKSERYYYDAQAIAEEGVVPAGTRRTIGKPKDDGVTRAEAMGREPSGNEARGFVHVSGTRNARTVWTIATQPYPEAHFATFPEELARRCIVAGSAPGDTVLDPFSGSGTVAAVAVGNGRAAIGIDLNPAYQDLARQRIGPMFTEVTP